MHVEGFWLEYPFPKPLLKPQSIQTPKQAEKLKEKFSHGAPTSASISPPTISCYLCRITACRFVVSFFCDIIWYVFAPSQSFKFIYHQHWCHMVQSSQQTASPLNHCLPNMGLQCYYVASILCSGSKTYKVELGVESMLIEAFAKWQDISPEEWYVSLLVRNRFLQVCACVLVWCLLVCHSEFHIESTVTTNCIIIESFLTRQRVAILIFGLYTL